MLSFKTSTNKKRQKISASGNVVSAACDSDEDSLSESAVVEVLRSVEAGELKPLHEVQKIQPLIIPVPVIRDVEVNPKRITANRKAARTDVGKAEAKSEQSRFR